MLISSLVQGDVCDRERKKYIVCPCVMILIHINCRPGVCERHVICEVALES